MDSLQRTWDTWASDGPTNWLIGWRLEVVAAVAGLLIVIWALSKREWGYSAYMATFLVPLLVSSYYYSIPRMLLTFFPLFLFLADFTGRHRHVHDWAVISFGSFAAMGVVIFTRGAWFY